jgi:hypothetical protein
VPPLEEVQFETVGTACSPINALDLPVAGNCTVNLETVIEYADVNEKWHWSKKTLQVRDIDQFVQARCDLHPTVIHVSEASHSPKVTIANDFNGLYPLIAQSRPQGHGPTTREAHHPQSFTVDKW